MSEWSCRLDSFLRLAVTLAGALADACPREVLPMKTCHAPVRSAHAIIGCWCWPRSLQAFASSRRRIDTLCCYESYRAILGAKLDSLVAVLKPPRVFL